MSEETAPADHDQHNEKMRKHKAARDKIMATKNIEKGLLIVHTGKGKGKTTAAMGEGFTWETQDRQRDIEMARQAWEAAKSYIADPAYKMVLCDELNIALRY